MFTVTSRVSLQDMQLQVYYSVTDQMLHGSLDASADLGKLVHDLQRSYYSVPPVPNTVRLSSLSPITRSRHVTCLF